MYNYENWKQGIDDNGDRLKPPGEARVRRSENTASEHAQALQKRNSSEQISDFWELSQISTPRDTNWIEDKDQGGRRVYRRTNSDGRQQFVHYFDSLAGRGQYVYVTEDGIWEDHPVCTNLASRSTVPKHPPPPLLLYTVSDPKGGNN